MARLAAMAVLVWALGGCGHRGSSAAPSAPRDAGVARDAAAADLPERPLGLADRAGFAWRTRAGQAAFRTARAAEARDDWPGVLAACREALAADPGHLEAAYLEAVALAKTGQLAAVVAPLALAEAGDFGKWGTASLDQPALQPFLATPGGQAWRRRVEQDEPRYTAAIAHALVVLAGGDLFAFDPAAPRWYRLTSTYGSVVAAFRLRAAAHVPQVAYVSRVRVRGSHERRFRIGLVDLATGHTTAPVDLDTGEPIHVAWSRKAAAFVVRGKALWLLDAHGKLLPAPPHADDTANLDGGTWLDVKGRHATLRHVALGVDTRADWDEQGLASAMRLVPTNRIVAAPSPGRIDGATVAWSRGRAHVAFVAQLDETCTAGAENTGAYVADAATGSVQELERAKHGLALEWLDEVHLAVAGDRGVSIVELGRGAQLLDGADALVTPRRQPRCVPEPVDEIPDEDPAEAGSVPGSVPVPADAGVPHPP